MSCLDFDWNYVESVDQVGKNFPPNIEYFDQEHKISLYLHLL